MKRTTRRSSIFLPPPASMVKEERIVGSSFDTKFSLPSFIRRVEKLTEDQRAAINRTGFGNILNIHNQMISKVLLGELMERWDSEKMTFKLLQGEVTITAQDVALILGLRVIGKSVDLDGAFSVLEQEYGATPNNRKINISRIEEGLESIGDLVNEDFVRTFLLYTFGVFLFPNSSGKVDSHFLALLEDLDKVHEYAWGEAVRQDLFSWIKKRKEENVRLVGGCLLLLQVWSYEHIDIGRPNLLASGQFPRASRWESIRSSYQRQWLSTKINKLEEDQITWVLQPTTTESEIDVVKQFLQAESPNEEVLVDQSFEVTELQCEESVDCHPETDETIPRQCAPNEDLGKDVYFRQEVVSISSDSTSEITVSSSETKETAESQSPQNLNSEKELQMVEEVSEASGVSSSETKETAESQSPQNLNSEKELQMVEEVSEASGYISESPEISSCTRDLEVEDKDCLLNLSQKLATLQVQELEDLKKENAMLKDQVLLIPQLQDENSKLKEENSTLKEENADLKAEVEDLKQRDQQVNSTCIGLERMLSEYSFSKIGLNDTSEFST